MIKIEKVGHNDFDLVITQVEKSCLYKVDYKFLYIGCFLVSPAMGVDGFRDIVLVFLQQLHDLKIKIRKF